MSVTVWAKFSFDENFAILNSAVAKTTSLKWYNELINSNSLNSSKKF
jgi:hypothetical protein